MPAGTAMSIPTIEATTAIRRAVHLFVSFRWIGPDHVGRGHRV
ncbi:hypothetical protein SNL152K_1273 [Streptomyces sp. NL15-2K]|nr:hypothetical protein SNL152K_1273 [Streptomyces sp. NL15-2K]